MERIELDPSELPSFREFLNSPGVVVIEKKETDTEEIFVCNTNQQFIITKPKSDESLIFGKDQTTGIVSVEVDGNQTIIFKQNKSGIVQQEIKPHKFWFLTSKPALKTASRLKGDLHYKWINYVDSEEEYDSMNLYKMDAHKVYDKKEMSMLQSGITYFKGLKHNEVSILAFDLETNGIKLDNESKILLIANTFRSVSGKIERKLFSYDDYKTQKELIDSWCSWVNEQDPSILCGHNVYTFDLPFLKHVAEINGTDLSIGRNGHVVKFNERESRFRKDGSQFINYYKVQVFGREIIDTMFLSIKYDVARNFENYKLKSIIKFLGLEKEGRQFYDASKIRDNYKIESEFKKIKKYAEEDGDDSLALYDLMAPAYFYMTQSIPKSFQAVIESASGSQINSMLVRSYISQNHSIPAASEASEFQGAISLGMPGIYKNAFKVDAVSLYPSIMREFRVYDQKKDPSGNFLKLTEYFAIERLNNKKKYNETQDKYYDDLQSSQKILINSMYGFMGAAGLNFNSPAKASFVTEKGREILNKAIEWCKNKNFTLINCDTDSIMFHNNEKSMDEKTRVDFLTDLNSFFPDKITFSDDGYYDKVIVLKAKNYLLWDGKKVKIKGSALKSSTKSLALKEFMQAILDSMLNETFNYVEIYNKYILEAMNVKDMSRWAGKKTYTDKVENSDRTNETKIKTALEGSEYVSGDKFYVFYREDDSLCLIENFNGDYNKQRLIKQVWDTAMSFETIIDPETFPKYHLKKNANILKELVDLK